AQQDLAGGDGEVVPQKPAVGPERGGDVAGRREQELVDAAEVGVELPASEEGEHEQRGAHQSAPPCSARIACSRSETIAPSVRDRGRGRGTGRSATTRPGRGDSTTTRSASTTASSTSCVTNTTVRGSRSSAPASHACISARVSASREAY